MPDTLTITELGNRGEGIALLDGARVFVAHALPGETVSARVDGQNAEIITIINPSLERVTPPCPHAGGCGGCQVQHWEISAYRTWKRQLVVKALTHVGIDVEIAPLIDASGNGRRRVTMHGRAEGAGFNALRSHKVHNIDVCPILVPALAPAADITRACYRAIGDCDVSITASDTGLDVAIRAKAKPNYPALTNIAAKYKLGRLSHNGEPAITHVPPEIKMGKAVVRLPVSSFLQATSAAEDIIAQHVVAACKGAKRVADLFSGLGPFALRLAETAKTYAVDSDKLAIAACDAAMKGTPGLKRMGSEARDLFKDPLVASELKQFDAVVLDPPRAGAQAQVRELILAKVPKIVSVSCDVNSFARDASHLIAGGYKLQSLTPIDQFIWSAHVETVAVFTR